MGSYILSKKPMNSNESKCRTPAPRQSRFCALEYRPRSWDVAFAGVGPVILLVLMDNGKNLRFFAHPELDTVVEGPDMGYIETLLEDLMERAQQDPETLFKQRSSLGGGPIVTGALGSDVSNHPSLEDAVAQFVKLD